jgi:hypothetical protein
VACDGDGVTDPAALERGYRRLLAWYPRGFRRERADEMLTVLMAGARDGQRRPSAAETVNLIVNGLRLRLRGRGQGTGHPRLDDAMAVFSVTGPLFLLAADSLQVAFPYRYRLPPGIPPGLARILARHNEVGGLSLLKLHFFQIAVSIEVLIAVLVLLGLRWVALAALAGLPVYCLAQSQWVSYIPDPVQLLTAGLLLVESVALIASPGPRRGRDLLTWRHGLVLALAAGAFQLSALWYAAGQVMVLAAPSRPRYFLAASIVLGAAAAGLAMIGKTDRYLLIPLAVMFYPYVVQLAVGAGHGDLLRLPSPGHLAALFAPPLLFAAAAFVTAARRHLGAAPGRVPG